MKGRLWIPVAIFLAGVACIVAAALSGDAEVQLFIVFPVISGNSLLFVLGVLLIVASFIIGFVFAAVSIAESDGGRPPSSEGGAEAHTGEGARKETKFGSVVLIGPVPVIFGSDRKMALITVILAIILTAIVLALALVTLLK